MIFKIIKCAIVFILQTLNYAHSQDITAQIGTHYSSHKLTDLSDILKSQVLSAELPVSLKLVDDYPSSNGINIGIFKRIKEKYELGAFYLLNSSGGSAVYSDYSGEVKFEHLIIAHTIGITGSNYLIKKKRIQSLIKLNVGASFSNLDLIFYANVLGVKDQTKVSFKSFSLDIYPEIEFRFFIPVLQIQSYLFFDLGYDLNIPSNLFLKNNKDAYLLTPDGNNATANWTGIRAKIGIGISFK
jgi:hypothetical protein